MQYNARLVFLTPCFSHGATDASEIRAASIRGMLHHWLRILGGTARQERTVFGGINFGQRSPFQDDSASRIVVRVRLVGNERREEFPALPHKHGGQASHRNAFAPGQSFDLLVSDRLGGLPEPESALFKDALHAWLLMGTLGYRSTRAAGSFAFESQDFASPQTPEEYQALCTGITARHGNKVSLSVLGRDFTNAEEARRLVSDSLGGRNPPNEENELRRLNDPLGRIHGGRKTSPLKYRIVRFGGNYRILAVWDNRSAVTGNRQSDLAGLIRLFQCRKPELGHLLAAGFGI